MAKQSNIVIHVFIVDQFYIGDSIYTVILFKFLYVGFKNRFDMISKVNRYFVVNGVKTYQLKNPVDKYQIRFQLLFASK